MQLYIVCSPNEFICGHCYPHSFVCINCIEIYHTKLVLHNTAGVNKTREGNSKTRLKIHALKSQYMISPYHHFCSFLWTDVSSNQMLRSLSPLIIQYLFSQSMELTINSFMFGITKLLHYMAKNTMSVQKCLYVVWMPNHEIFCIEYIWGNIIQAGPRKRLRLKI